jgi:hypothetical protein
MKGKMAMTLINVEEQENNKTKLQWSIALANGLERKEQMELVTVEVILIDSIILMPSSA